MTRARVLPPPPARRSQRFLLAVALANAGGVVAWLPLLSLLLPLKVEALAADARLGLLSTVSIAGALAASLSNIGFGMLSDRAVAAGGSRRGWIAAGAAATVLSYLAILAAPGPAALLAAVVLFQSAVNALLGPLTATIGDEVPDAQGGTAGGLLALGVPVASAVSASLVAAATIGEGGRMLAVCLAFTVMVGPLLLVPARAPLGAVTAEKRTGGRRDLLLAWLARLLLQLPGVVMVAYALFFFRGLTPGVPGERVAADVGALLACSAVVALPVAVAAGVAADRLDARRGVLVAAAGVAAAGLALMAGAGDWWPAAVGFVIHAAGNATFLGLNTAQAIRLLPVAERRGRDLGLLNLANTAPALIGPALTWALATATDFRVLLLVLAGSALAGGAVTAAIGRTPRGQA